MKLVITGATGLIGSILTDRLWNQFHSVVLLSRKPPSEINVTKKEWFAWQPGVGGEWEKAIDGADGIINLAGEPIAAKRWSVAQKAKLRSSRIDATRSLVDAISKANVKPKFLINASAVGYYGPHGDETVYGKDRLRIGLSLASLCRVGRRGKKGRSVRRQSRAGAHRHRARQRQGSVSQDGRAVQDVRRRSLRLRPTVDALDSYRR